MGSTFKKMFGTPKGKEMDDYVYLDLEEYEPISELEPAEMYVKVAELSAINELSELSHELRNEVFHKGNILVVQVSQKNKDKILLKKVIDHLREVAEEVNGDIAGFEKQVVIVVTPMGVKIDRTKLIQKEY